MPPLMVVQTLAESQYATLSDIKVCEESSKQSLPVSLHHRVGRLLYVGTQGHRDTNIWHVKNSPKMM